MMPAPLTRGDSAFALTISIAAFSAASGSDVPAISGMHFRIALDPVVGWVSQIREAEFGPDGGNEDIESLASKIDDMIKEMEGIKGDCVAIQKDAESIIKMAKAAMASNDKKLAEVSTMKADLERIKKAVGTRTLKAAGCK